MADLQLCSHPRVLHNFNYKPLGGNLYYCADCSMSAETKFKIGYEKALKTYVKLTSENICWHYFDITYNTLGDVKCHKCPKITNADFAAGHNLAVKHIIYILISREGANEFL